MEQKERQYSIDIIAAFAERTVKRLWVLVVLLAVLLAASWAGFLWYLNQYDFESYTTEYTQDGRGLNIIGDRNGVDYHGSTIPNDAPDAD